ncbi:unnamed protein product [Meganyctiphanes norvegica]|uniref:Uncharacterized protein n=1 Tax=Meganyctiphanes norvegica TaxID=48144 RepID=A0AAV2S5F8_MEGNR
MITITVQFAAPNDGSIPGLVHPRIGESRCWFNDENITLLCYYYGPTGVLMVINTIFLANTYNYLRIIRGDNKSPNDPDGYTLSSAEISRKYDFFAAFWQRFYLLVLICGCYIADVLAWKIPPRELWAITDFLNVLQGSLVLLIFLCHRNKRHLVREKLPKIFQLSNFCTSCAKSVQNNKILSSKIISNLNPISSYSKNKNSSSSFDLNKNNSSVSTPSTGIRSLSLTWNDSKPVDSNDIHPENYDNHISSEGSYTAC